MILAWGSLFLIPLHLLDDYLTFFVFVRLHVAGDRSRPASPGPSRVRGVRSCPAGVRPVSCATRSMQLRSRWYRHRS